jgi:hypothetical protein
MTKKHTTYRLRQTLVLGLAVVATIIGISIGNPVAFRTTNIEEASILIENLESEKEEKVLGAGPDITSIKDSGCSADKPIIGWIDFRGKKVIKQNLPEGQRASGCFETLEIAKQNGFVAEKIE